MKKAALFTTGLVSGAILATTISVSADMIAGRPVTAIIPDKIAVRINGEYKNVPSEYTILNYGNYNYMPYRYVAESLGATVNYDGITDTIEVQAPEPQVVEKIVEKIVYVDREVPVPVPTPTDNYSALPVSSTKENIMVRVNDIFVNSDYCQVPIYLKNENGQFNVQIDPISATLEADGKIYKASEANASGWDMSLVNSMVAPDKYIEGYIMFPKLENENATQFKLKIPVLTQEVGGPKTTMYEFSFKK